MSIGNIPMSGWIKMRYQIVHENRRLGSYSAWDVIRLFDEGQITEDTLLVLMNDHYDRPSRFAEKDAFIYMDALRPLVGPHGQVLMIALLTQIRTSLIVIAVIAALTLINGLYYFIRIQ